MVANNIEFKIRYVYIYGICICIYFKEYEIVIIVFMPQGLFYNDRWTTQ